MTGALAARGSTEDFTLDWRHEQAVASSYRRQVGMTLFDVEANVCLWHIADYLSRLAECPLSGVKRTLFHAARHVR